MGIGGSKKFSIDRGRIKIRLYFFYFCRRGFHKMGIIKCDSCNKPVIIIRDNGIEEQLVDQIVRFHFTLKTKKYFCNMDCAKSYILNSKEFLELTEKHDQNKRSNNAEVPIITENSDEDDEL